MSKRRLFSLLTVLVLVCSFFTGCGNDGPKVESPILGKWAYIHDDETMILQLKDNGVAIYHKEKYNFTDENGFLILKADGKEDLKLRYTIDGEDILLYEHEDYYYQGEGTPEGLVGLWENDETKWSLEFTSEGSFLEETYFPGYYTVDEENSSFKLMYTDKFEDTTCYYQIEGNTLHVEYPWKMVKM